MGAASNEDDPTVGSGIGEELAVMLDPTPLLGSLKFTAAGHSQVAGRATITADAAPRPSDPRHGPRSFELHELGSGADHYTLQVDAQLGVLLEVVALRDGEPFHKITTVEIAFDHPIPDERFQFQPPAGEELRSAGGQPRPQHLSLPEAQQRAPFTVLIPDRIPDIVAVAHSILIASYHILNDDVSTTTSAATTSRAAPTPNESPNDSSPNSNG